MPTMGYEYQKQWLANKKENDPEWWAAYKVRYNEYMRNAMRRKYEREHPNRRENETRGRPRKQPTTPSEACPSGEGSQGA